MATRPPPQTKAILATPLNVEESKAQRLQRSQARFRDRGGIFVPSNRNTLADILLGKAPPLTKPRKSVSASPSLRRQSKGRRSSPRKSNANVLRRSKSPVKQSRKSMNGGSREAVANLEFSTEPNVATASTKTHKGKQLAKPAARRSSTKGSKPAEGDPPNEESDSYSNVNPEPPTKAGTKSKSSKKPVTSDAEAHPPEKPRSKPKKASKGAGQNAPPEMEDSTELKNTTGKRAPQASVQSKSAAIKSAESLNERQHPQSTSTAARTAITNARKVSNAPAAPASSAEAGPSMSARPIRRKSGDLYSCGESEDEYVPKVSKKKKAPARTSSSGKSVPAEKPTGPRKSALPAIMEEDEDQEEKATQSSSNLQRSTSIPTPKNKSDKSSSGGLKSSSSKTKASTTESSKSSRSKGPAAADPEPEIKAKKSTSGKGSSAKGKQVVSQDGDTLEIAPEKAGQASSTKSNKRRADDIDSPEEEPEPPTKRSKSSGKAAQNAKTTSGLKKTASSKRSRDEDDEDNDTVGEAQDARPKKSTKRKKTVDESDADAPPPSKPKKGTTPAAAAKAKKSASKDSNGAKKAAKKSAKKTGRKENTSSEKASQPQAPVVKRGPPKSVLARIKASAQVHEVDNDPDEIDFLS